MTQVFTSQLLEKDMQFLSNFIKVAPIEVIKQFKNDCVKLNHSKLTELMPLFNSRLTT